MFAQLLKTFSICSWKVSGSSLTFIKQLEFDEREVRWNQPLLPTTRGEIFRAENNPRLCLVDWPSASLLCLCSVYENTKSSSISYSFIGDSLSVFCCLRSEHFRDEAILLKRISGADRNCFCATELCLLSN